MDKISDLSDDLLLKILSSLPTKDVITTMLLSNRWKFLWTMVPKLYFADLECNISNYARFLKYVDRIMVLHRAPVLETLKFEVGPCCSSQDMATWVRIGMARAVSELDICLCEESYYYSATLPKCLYTCLETCFRGGCPVLEKFVLDKTLNNDVISVYVEIPTIQRLTIVEKNEEPNDGGNEIFKIVINVPSLKYLNFVDFYGDLCLSEKMPELVEVNVTASYENSKMLMGSVTSVKRLSLCLSRSMLHDRIGFYQLVYLELCGCVPNWWNRLTWMLESSPKLQVLKLNKCKDRGYRPIEPIKGSWGQPSSVPECLLLHLHTFEWKYYNGGPEEKTLVAYILKNARHLKIATFSYYRGLESEKQRKLGELVSLPRASYSCQLLME